VILKLIQFTIGLIGVTLLFWAGLWTGFWWDSRPTHYPKIHVPLLFGCCTWTAPESLKAQLGGIIAQEQAAARLAKAETMAEEVLTVQAEARELAAQARIVYVTRTLQKEVPGVITQQMDRSFPVSTGFVRLHDAAATGVDVSQISDPAGRPDDAASDLKSSAVISTIIANYGAARGNAEELTALQQWIRDTTANFNQGPPS
jgi:hypothetical protein